MPCHSSKSTAADRRPGSIYALCASLSCHCRCTSSIRSAVAVAVHRPMKPARPSGADDRQHTKCDGRKIKHRLLSRCRWGRGGPSPGADVAGVGPDKRTRPVLRQAVVREGPSARRVADVEVAGVLQVHDHAAVPVRIDLRCVGLLRLRCSFLARLHAPTVTAVAAPRPLGLGVVRSLSILSLLACNLLY